MSPSTPEPRITRGHKKKARTRQQLLRAAVDVIGQRGESFTISDVATRAGVSNGTFYNYFDDREALIDAIVPEVLGAFAAESAVTVDESDPARRFAIITALGLTRAATEPDAIRVVLRLDAVQQAITEGATVAHLRADLRAGMATGRFADLDEDAAIDVIVGAMLLAGRRLVDAPARPGAIAGLITQLLCSLGLDRAEAMSIAGEAEQSASRDTPMTKDTP